MVFVISISITNQLGSPKIAPRNLFDGVDG